MHEVNLDLITLLQNARVRSASLMFLAKRCLWDLGCVTPNLIYSQEAVPCFCVL